jgi:mannose-1-phosphate guanylyltransferase / mannose-6-phosphate isomerase
VPPLPDIIPVILAGGEGRRLWPLTGANRPKPLLKLRGQSLLQMTATRMTDMQAPVVIANRRYAQMVSRDMADCKVTPQQIFLEPEGRGTAPAAAVAAHYFRGSGADPLLLVMPSDHLIERPAVLADAVQRGALRARQGELVMFGVEARRAATGYGYIRRNDENDNVMQFVEKPERRAAKQFLNEKGSWLWNSGIFLFSASAFLDRLKVCDPVLHDISRHAVARATRRQNAVLLDEAAFHACPAASLDRAVMEKEGARTVIPVDMGWRDLGSRASFLRRLMGI